MSFNFTDKFKNDKKFRSNFYFVLFLAAIFLGVIIHSCTYNTDQSLNTPEDKYNTPKINSVHVALGVPEDKTPGDDW